jgi:hypothetical protein
MRKTIAVVAVFLYISMLVLTATAQTPDSSSATPQSSSSLIGEIIAVIGIVAIFAVIAYAGYKVIKKWSYSQ